MRIGGTLCLVGCAAVLGAASPAHAEWFADLYGGVAYTERSDVTFVVQRPTASLDHTFHDVKWDNSSILGVRAGYWFAAAPWYGVGLDLFHFDADVPTQAVNSTIAGNPVPVTLQAMDFSIAVLAFDVVRLRYPFLASAQYPHGRLQPYASAGPAVFRVRVQNKGNGELTTQPETDTTTGYKLGAGLSWHLTRSAAIFGEYRFTHVESEVQIVGTITGGRVPIRFDLDTHHIVAGVSFRF